MAQEIAEVEETEATEGTEEVTEEVTEIEIPEAVQSDPLGGVMSAQIADGIKRILEGNKILLAEEDTSGVREIDKAFKLDAEKSDDSEDKLSENLRELWKSAEEARKSYKELLEKARNGYRVEVLQVEAEESVDEQEVDEEELRNIRVVVMNGVSFLQSYAKTNGKPAVGEWVDTLQIPQVGRKGTSTVGVKKPRVNVFVKNENDAEGNEVSPTIYESFSQAAAALSDKENKYTASEIAQAWNDSADASADKEFEFGGKTLFIRVKEEASK